MSMCRWAHQSGAWQEEGKQTDSQHGHNWDRPGAGSSVPFFPMREQEETEALLGCTKIFDLNLIFIPVVRFLEIIHDGLFLVLATALWERQKSELQSRMQVESKTSRMTLAHQAAWMRRKRNRTIRARSRRPTHVPSATFSPFTRSPQPCCAGRGSSWMVAN